MDAVVMRGVISVARCSLLRRWQNGRQLAEAWVRRRVRVAAHLSAWLMAGGLVGPAARRRRLG